MLQVRKCTPRTRVEVEMGEEVVYAIAASKAVVESNVMCERQDLESFLKL
ncbi:hypothetical protein SNOG_13718 [Parastagonospora nodorum SN15]|uniref:Uncharacterized protein n=1 Tax=Phaeosphaeria nodorum (strain SN15 / ATCC MYA-4574 / FGSC 10173) TaxID=321614 RepID=Q0U3E6_PHANO|nr:hypothetical protein SNOG_13718 [Parastagonospora nodorum SN15]EAT78742.1 hypothetical protein SNOG_13718 [Parastagonospora nodorum SN15]